MNQVTSVINYFSSNGNNDEKHEDSQTNNRNTDEIADALHSEESILGQSFERKRKIVMKVMQVMEMEMKAMTIVVMKVNKIQKIMIQMMKMKIVIIVVEVKQMRI